MNLRALLPIAAALGAVGYVAGALAQQPIAIATPPSGSIYNSTAAAIGKVLGEKAGLRMTLQALGGSSQYLPIVNAGEVPFGIANVYETSLAVTGEDYFKGRPTKELRTVAVLYPLRNTIFVKKDSKYKKLADLKGARGPVGFTNQKILTAVTNAALAPGGITLDDVEGVNVSNIIANSNAFKEGRTDFFVFALGSAPVREADAAVGGKNGVNLDGYKNIVGVFNQPRFVLLDFEVLRTLPAEEVLCGVAEIVKHALVGELGMFDYLERRWRRLLALERAVVEEVVGQSVSFKARVVSADEKEAGGRRILNFGHTLAHALEKTAGVSHGEAVGMGMAFAARVSEARGLLSTAEAGRIEALLRKVGLPAEKPAATGALFEAVGKDKKREGGALHFVLLAGIGRPVITKLTLEQLYGYIHDLC